MIKELLGDLFLIVAAGFILYNLVMIMLLGKVYIFEDNRIVLWLEVVLTSTMVILGIERLINDIKRFR